MTNVIAISSQRVGGMGECYAGSQPSRGTDSGWLLAARCVASSSIIVSLMRFIGVYDDMKAINRSSSPAAAEIAMFSTTLPRIIASAKSPSNCEV